MHAPELFGGAFAPLTPWHAWLVFAQAVFAEPMAEEARKIFHACTGRQTPPQKPVGMALATVGRRGGKSRFAAALAVYLACFRDYRSVLAPGERGTVMLIAADRRQARVMRGYIQALVRLPALQGLVAASRREAISLRNGLTIEVHTASFRTVRGYTVVAAVRVGCAFRSS